jgi:sulfite reductase alpha subunit-like flavoprotein
MQNAEILVPSILKRNEATFKLNSEHVLPKACPFSIKAREPPHESASNPVRELLDSNPVAVDGFLSYEYGLCAPKPLEELKHKYLLWEVWAKKLPELYRTGKYQEYFRAQPVLTLDELKDEDLLRANQILGLCAHAVVHFSDDQKEQVTRDFLGSLVIRENNVDSECPSTHFQQQQAQCPFKPQHQTAPTSGNSSSEKKRNNEHRIPPAILEPWKAVNVRLGRPKPTFTYYDYFTLNVVPKNGDRSKRFGGLDDRPSIYTNMKCDVQVFGDRSENVFVLMNHDMEFQSTPLISLACNAIDCIHEVNDDKLMHVLHAMGNVVSKVTQTFLMAEPNSYSKLYCDPVSWSKSIGMLIPPILDGEMSMSGLQSSFTHLVDVLIGRYEYDGELGTLALEERPWLPKLHQEFFHRLSKCSIRSHVTKSKNQALHGSFNRLVRLFVHGFLESHRLKICGFLELGIKTGRTESSGQAAQATGGWQSRAWRKVNEDCLYSMKERERLQINPCSNGFVGAFVESITELSPGSESYRIVFDTASTGVQYQAGDRVEILPSNRSELVTKTLEVLGVSGGCEVAIDSAEWKAAVSQHYPDKAGQPVFPLASLLKIMTLRPLTKAMFDELCGVTGIVDRRSLELRFQGGMIDDVPDLLEFLIEAGDEETPDLIVVSLCSALPPLNPRMYSVANSPTKDGMHSKVSIVVSRLWYQVGSSSVAERKSSWILGGSGGKRLGVCTSFLLNDSLYQFVPLRIVEATKFRLPDEDDMENTIVMIALGSGAAPMLAFIEELLTRGRDICPQVYFCWGLAAPQNLFGQHLLERAIREIGLKVCISFSREAQTVKLEEGKITIVPGRQERITTTLSKDEWPCILSRIASGNGIFYLCGHPMLDGSVRSVIEHALSSSRKHSLQESSEQYIRMVAANRIRSDLYYSGSLHSAGLPDFSASDVARHNNPNDLWWIYKVSKPTDSEAMKQTVSHSLLMLAGLCIRHYRLCQSSSSKSLLAHCDYFGTRSSQSNHDTAFAP